jgi:hypothetical protein
MNQALPTGAKSSHAPDKVVYFATGAPGEVEADFERLRLACNGTRLRVVVPARYVRQVEQLPPLQGDEVLAYRPALAPLLWLRLWGFLGFSRRTEIVCLSAQERYRFLKFLALTLRGRVIFSPVSGKRVPLGPWALLVIWARQRLDAREQARRHLPIGVIGSASAFYLTGIVKVLRARYPGAPLHGLLLRDRMASSAPLFDAYRVLRPGLLPAVGEAWRMARSRRSYQRWVIPCTNEAGHALKLLAFLWPLSRRQIYNELGDGFAVRDVRTLWAHLRWRLRDHLSFQIVAGTAGKSAPARLAHLTLYALGLLRAAVLLGWVRLRGRRADWAVRPREAACERSTGERASGVTSDEETKTVGVGRSRGAVVVPQLPGGPSGPA